MNAKLQEFMQLVRIAGGPRAAARRMHVSPSHVVNILHGRRTLFPGVLAKARANLTPGAWTCDRSYVRVLGAVEYERIHGHAYPYNADDEDDDGDDWRPLPHP